MNDRKKSWFDLGARALQRLFPDAPVHYMCPLCLTSYYEDDLSQLTFEHVPPRSVGGQRLVLTCRVCNEQASGKDGIDTHAKRRENVLIS